MTAISDFSDRPSIYITGYPRSGTTWVCRSLAHANIFARRKPDVLMRRGIAGEWKEVLTPKLANMIAEYCGDVMDALGYWGGT